MLEATAVAVIVVFVVLTGILCTLQAYFASRGLWLQAFEQRQEGTFLMQSSLTD